MSTTLRSEPAAADGEPLHGLCLSLRQWGVVAVLLLIACWASPQLWWRGESFTTTANYRVPQAFSQDYWIYRKWIATLAEQGRLPLIGDSVIWGEYVLPNETLDAALDGLIEPQRFANAGLTAAHPLALWGLVRHYAHEAAPGRVLLHCNLLWLTSAERDLQTEQEQAFNHPGLVPQFVLDIPGYHQSAERRLAIAVDRLLPFRCWARHLRWVCWDGQDLHRWSLEHPYANPLAKLTLALPQPAAALRHRPISWVERKIPQQEFCWIDIDTSLQWHAFQQTIRTLQQRGHRVLVLVGPFNEHLLAADSRQRYRQIKRDVANRLREQGIACVVPAVLPSEEYADASHPLAAGYARLARELSENVVFQAWLGPPVESE